MKQILTIVISASSLLWAQTKELQDTEARNSNVVGASASVSIMLPMPDGNQEAPSAGSADIVTTAASATFVLHDGDDSEETATTSNTTLNLVEATEEANAPTASSDAVVNQMHNEEATQTTARDTVASNVGTQEEAGGLRDVTQLDPEVFAIAKDLRCPVCRAESVAGSSAPISIEMRQIIQEKLEAGESRQDILAYFQTRYGDYIVLDPPRRGIYLIVWIVPLFAALLAMGLLIRFMQRWTKQAHTIPETRDEDVTRVRALLHDQLDTTKQENNHD